MERTAKARRVGLARALSKLGYCSRAQAAELIRAGRVRLNGAVRRDPESPVRLGSDRIEVDGSAIGAREFIYLMMNKPRGLVTSASDEQGRPTVYSLLEAGGWRLEAGGERLPSSEADSPNFLLGGCTLRQNRSAQEYLPAGKAGYKAPTAPWVAPVGRLDKASEGLLLFANDSEWAARITDPASHLDKTYHVQIGAQDGEAISRQLVRGLQVGGKLLRAKQARVLRAGDRNSWLEIVLDEGKNRQIRRMLEYLIPAGCKYSPHPIPAGCTLREKRSGQAHSPHPGIEVLRLVRVAIGPLRLGDLPKGKFRTLDPAEKRALDVALESSRRNSNPK